MTTEHEYGWHATYLVQRNDGMLLSNVLMSGTVTALTAWEACILAQIARQQQYRAQLVGDRMLPVLMSYEVRIATTGGGQE